MSESNSVRLQGLLDRLQGGDEAARAELLAGIVRRLEAMAHKALRSFPGVHRWEQTSDVVQNTLLRVHKSLQQQVPGTVREFFGFAAMLMRRELITLLRHYHGPEGHGARHDSQGGEPGAADHHADPAPDPERLTQWARFPECIEGLPALEREVFTLVWYHNLEQLEVAQVLGVSESTVKRHWRQARLLLAERLGRDFLE
jgi:RNA polymerase sigma-70 factor (ECF subfamily)